MEVYIKSFDELSKNELYSIMKLRVDTFVVEQNCPYPELDGNDPDAVHVYLKEGDEILAYLRVLDRGVESDNVSIGRVIAAERRRGWGSRVVREGIRAAKEIFGAELIYIEAQVYAKEFYEKLGFRQTSEEFLLDGIPHIKMELEIER